MSLAILLVICWLAANVMIVALMHVETSRDLPRSHTVRAPLAFRDLRETLDPYGLEALPTCALCLQSWWPRTVDDALAPPKHCPACQRAINTVEAQR